MVGWREWVDLPDLCDSQIKAKIDTGARTSALHAFGLRVFERDGSTLARFEIHPRQRSAEPSYTVEVPVRAFRTVRSSTGHRERRPVIATRARLGDHEFGIELTLTSRDAMGFRMLLGRAAVRRRFWVDPGRSYLAGRTAPQRPPSKRDR